MLEKVQSSSHCLRSAPRSWSIGTSARSLKPASRRPARRITWSLVVWTTCWVVRRRCGSRSNSRQESRSCKQVFCDDKTAWLHLTGLRATMNHGWAGRCFRSWWRRESVYQFHVSEWVRRGSVERRRWTVFLIAFVLLRQPIHCTTSELVRS